MNQKLCKRVTRNGDPCKNKALPRSDYCFVHSILARKGWGYYVGLIGGLASIITVVIYIILLIQDKENTPEKIEGQYKEGKLNIEEVIELGEKEEKKLREKLINIQILVLKAYYNSFREDPNVYHLYSLLQKYTDAVEQEINLLREIGIEFLAVADTIRLLGFGQFLHEYLANKQIYILSDKGLAGLTELKIYTVEDKIYLTKIFKSYNEGNYLDALEEIEQWKKELKERQNDFYRLRLKFVNMPYFVHKLRTLKWINYTPFKAGNKNESFVHNKIREDLKLLRESGFLGIVLDGFESSYKINIPKLAHEMGMKGCILGIKDISNASEKEYAFNVRRHVDAYFINNLKYPKIEYSTLSEAIALLRQRTGKPVSITNAYWDHFVKERSQYGGTIDALNENLLILEDWIFIEMTYSTNSLIELVMMDSRFHGFPQKEKRIVMYRRIPVPSERYIIDEEVQKNYYQNLIEETDLLFVFCEAFDQDTISGDGLFTFSRKPKIVIDYLTTPKIMITNRTWYCDLHLIKGKVLNISNPKNYKILTRINVDGRWWTKPYDAYPAIPIEEDYSWQVPIITGGIDYFCTEVDVCLVKKEYNPGYRSWPDSSNIIAAAQIIREAR